MPKSPNICVTRTERIKGLQLLCSKALTGSGFNLTKDEENKIGREFGWNFV